MGVMDNIRAKWREGVDDYKQKQKANAELRDYEREAYEKERPKYASLAGSERAKSEFDRKRQDIRQKYGPVPRRPSRQAAARGPSQLDNLFGGDGGASMDTLYGSPSIKKPNILKKKKRKGKRKSKRKHKIEYAPGAPSYVDQLYGGGF